MFRVGQEVVIINRDDIHRLSRNFGNPPPFRTPLRIIGMYVHPKLGVNCLRIKGWPNDCAVLKVDIGWDASRFRPLISQEQDNEMFRKIINTKELEGAGE